MTYFKIIFKFHAGTSSLLCGVDLCASQLLKHWQVRVNRGGVSQSHIQLNPVSFFKTELSCLL